MKANSKQFKKSIEYDLNKHFEELPFLKDYFILDRIKSANVIESYVILHRKTAREKILEVYSYEDFKKNTDSTNVGTIYKTEHFYYLIRNNQ